MYLPRKWGKLEIRKLEICSAEGWTVFGLCFRKKHTDDDKGNVGTCSIPNCDCQLGVCQSWHNMNESSSFGYFKIWNNQPRRPWKLKLMMLDIIAEFHKILQYMSICKELLTLQFKIIDIYTWPRLGCFYFITILSWI